MSDPRSLCLLVLEGDGIGPEIVAAARTVLEAAVERFGLALGLDTRAIGLAALACDGSTFPDEILAAARLSDGVILGPVSTRDYPPPEAGGRNPSALMRRELDLYANIRPARSRPGLPARVPMPFDLVIVRENTEGFYADRSMFRGSGEFMPTPDLAFAVRKISRSGSERIARAAFGLARRRRGKVTVVHKANVLRLSDGLFLETARAVAGDYPEIACDDCLADAMMAYLVRDPSPYDVVVTTNLFGDLMSDLASELSGSLGLAASLNAGDDHAVAQPQHGSAPDIAGADRANPAAMIGSVAMLLAWLAERRGHETLAAAARAIESALDGLLGDPSTRTADLGGAIGTRRFAELAAESVLRT